VSDAGSIHLPKLIADEFNVSRSEARRLLATGAVKLDGVPCRLVELNGVTPTQLVQGTEGER
jgi:16S rRNA U516 pseudouridylate synthase RsuA-like enzyme